MRRPRVVRYAATAADRQAAGEMLQLRPELADHAVQRAGAYARALSAELGMEVQVLLVPPGLAPVVVVNEQGDR